MKFEFVMAALPSYLASISDPNAWAAGSKPSSAPKF